MNIPTYKEVENYARLHAETAPRPLYYFNAFMECYDKFIKPLSSSSPSSIQRLQLKNEKPHKLCKICGNEEKTIDDTGLCERCRIDEYEEDNWMCDFD